MPAWGFRESNHAVIPRSSPSFISLPRVIPGDVSPVSRVPLHLPFPEEAKMHLENPSVTALPWYAYLSELAVKSTCFKEKPNGQAPTTSALVHGKMRENSRGLTRYS